MTINTDHLQLLVMDVSGGAEQAAIFSAETRAVTGVTCFFHGRRFYETMPVKEAAFGNFRPGDMTAAAGSMAVVTVEFPSCGQQGITHLVRLGDGADDVKDAIKFVVHGILV